MDLSVREQAAVDHAAGAEVFASRATIARGRADLRRRYDAPTFAEALRRHQMSADEHTARIDAMERRFEQLNATIERALSGRSGGSNGEVERQARRIEEDFTADELKMVRDHREYETFKRNAVRYGEDLEREAVLAMRSAGEDADEEDDDDVDDETADDDEDDESKDAPGKTQSKQKGKTGSDSKRSPKRKPPARHRDDDDGGGSDDDASKPTGLFAKMMAD